MLFSNAKCGEDYGNYGSSSSTPEEGDDNSNSESVINLKVTKLDETSLDNLLSFGYYRESCPKFEGILHSKLKQWIQKDRTLAASLLRLHFHDCSVRVSNYLTTKLITT